MKVSINDTLKHFGIIKHDYLENPILLKNLSKLNPYGKVYFFNDNLSQFHYVGKSNNTCYIKKLNDNEYIDLRDGEIKECKHIENRSQNLNSIKLTMKKIRDLINVNITPYNKNEWLFLTLTYRENMTDTKKSYNDFKNFIKRFKKEYTNYHSYISVIEPQGRGAWHFHVLVKFNCNAPYISNLDNLWKQGFVKIKSIGECDNFGAYFSAYLADIEFTNDTCIEYFEHSQNFKIPVVEKEIIENDKRITKKFIKGGRLYLYPPKMNIIRYSKNINKPVVVEMTYNKYKKKVGMTSPTFSQFSDIYLDGEYSHQLAYIEFNKSKNNCQFEDKKMN